MTGPTAVQPPTKYPFLAPAIADGDLGTFAGYRVLRLIGSGGMGFVFEAEDPTLRRRVAIKVLRPEVAAKPENAARFLQEARAVASLPAELTVGVYQIGQANGVPYLSMEMLVGETLQALLERTGKLPAAAVLGIGRQVAAALAVAHGVGMIHRDIKPANVWLEADPATGAFRRVRLLDFGLARSVDQDVSLTGTGVVIGTPQYMAPEQAEKGPLDARTDLFSLGGLMYRAATGRLAFDGDTPIRLLMALVKTDPPPVTGFCPEMPVAAAVLIHRLLEKEPALRPASASEVIAELDRELCELTAGGGILLALEGLPAGPGFTSNERRETGGLSDTIAADAPPTPGQFAFSLNSSHILGKLADAAADKSAVTPSPTTAPTMMAPYPTRHGPRPRTPWRGIALGGAAVVAIGVSLFLMFGLGKTPVVVPPPTGEPIPVGVLHSQSGPMKESEEPVIDATLLAIDEVNKAGGVLGRQLKPVIVDGKSSDVEFARGAKEQMDAHKVAVIFGCWTSASRKGVKPEVERADGLLFYPVQYEGLEQSPRIVYTGPAPNQQLLPAVKFLTEELGKKRLFLIGSDYVFPQSAHAIMTDVLKDRVVGEAFLPLGEQGEKVKKAVAEIVAAKPDAIINTINGNTNVAFFRELKAAGIDPARCPTLSVSIAENELRTLDPTATTGGYLVASYFQSVDRPENRAFVSAIQAKFGRDRVTSDMMASAYSGVKLWAKAATAAGSVEPNAVLAAVRGATYDGPGGEMTIDADTQHAWLPVRIGQIQSNGQLKLLPGSDAPIRPIPYPASRTPDDWNRFLTDLHRSWNYRWEAPKGP